MYDMLYGLGMYIKNVCNVCMCVLYVFDLYVHYDMYAHELCKYVMSVCYVCMHVMYVCVVMYVCCVF